jgi:hypothetical protein
MKPQTRIAILGLSVPLGILVLWQAIAIAKA